LWQFSLHSKINLFLEWSEPKSKFDRIKFLMGKDATSAVSELLTSSFVRFTHLNALILK